MRPPSGAPVVSFEQLARVPTGNGRFPPLSADTSQLVLCELDLSFLCYLKSVSWAVANACRRAIRSDTVLARRQDYFAMRDALQHCRLSYPVHAMLRPHDEEDWTYVDKLCCVLYGPRGRTTKEALVIHDLHAQVDRNAEQITTAELVRWVRDILNYYDESEGIVDDPFDGNSRQFRIVCDRLSAEVPKVGVVHDFHRLLDTLHIPDSVSRDEQFHFFQNARVEPNLLTRLMPFVRIGGREFYFDSSKYLGSAAAVYPVHKSLMFLLISGQVAGLDV